MEVDAILDTGATHTVLGLDYAKRFKLPIEASTISFNNVPKDAYISRHVFPVTVQGRRVSAGGTILVLKDFPVFVLGYPFLRSSFWDFEKDEVTFRYGEKNALTTHFVYKRVWASASGLDLDEDVEETSSF